jgi:SpoVK/Ycf46/Vps4 family AAA+-type ATPase
MDEIQEITDDLAHLARLASMQAYEDVRLLIARLIRKYRRTLPALAERLDQSLKTSQTHSGAVTGLRRADMQQAAGTAAFRPPVDSDSRLALVRVFDDRGGLPPPLLNDELMAQLEAVVLERHERERLASRGISPTRSAILVGPPGVGKTLSARWVASRLGKPLWVLDLTAVMSSLLGKTGSNLRAAMDYAKENEAVLLLDEIDAIAKRRSDESDVGELKRLVTVMLQEVDLWPDSGLLFAATNHPELVDPALWRRFDCVLTFGHPNATSIGAAIRRFAGADADALEPWIGTLTAALIGLSLSDIERSITALRRTLLLQNAEPSQLVSSLAASRLGGLDKTAQIGVAVELARTGVHSHHEIHQITGVARDTIRKHAGPSPRKGRGLK